MRRLLWTQILSHDLTTILPGRSLISLKTVLQIININKNGSRDVVTSWRERKFQGGTFADPMGFWLSKISIIGFLGTKIKICLMYYDLSYDTEQLQLSY